MQTKRLGANFVETSEPSDRRPAGRRDAIPATLFTFECGDVCQNAEALLNKRGVPFTIVDVQKDEQGMIRMKAHDAATSARPCSTLGEKLIVKGYNEGRWQAALDEAGYPKTPAIKRAAVGSREPAAPPPAPVTEGARAVTPAVKGGDYPK